MSEKEILPSEKCLQIQPIICTKNTDIVKKVSFTEKEYTNYAVNKGDKSKVIYNFYLITKNVI